MAMATASSDKAQLQTLKKATIKENKGGQTQKITNVKKEEGEEGQHRPGSARRIMARVGSALTMRATPTPSVSTT
jgi:hypothetical protein